MGLAPSDIQAWSEMSGTLITPVEFSILTVMDAAYLSAAQEHRREIQARYQESRDKPKKKPPRKK